MAFHQQGICSQRAGQNVVFESVAQKPVASEADGGGIAVDIMAPNCVWRQLCHSINKFFDAVKDLDELNSVY